MSYIFSIKQEFARFLTTHKFLAFQRIEDKNEFGLRMHWAADNSGPNPEAENSPHPTPSSGMDTSL